MTFETVKIESLPWRHSGAVNPKYEELRVALTNLPVGEAIKLDRDEYPILYKSSSIENYLRGRKLLGRSVHQRRVAGILYIWLAQPSAAASTGGVA